MRTPRKLKRYWGGKEQCQANNILNWPKDKFVYEFIIKVMICKVIIQKDESTLMLMLELRANIQANE